MRIIKKKIKFIIFLIIFIIISPIIVLYAKGDIFTNGWNILRTGGMYVTNAPIDSEVFVNAKSKGTTSFFNRDILIRNLRPATYDVLVKKEGYNAWTAKIKVTDSLVSDANIFILPVKADMKEIPKYNLIEKGSGSSTVTTKVKNQEYIDILAIFAAVPVSGVKKSTSTSTIDFKSNLGTKKSPVMSSKTGLWQEGNILFAKWFGSSDSAPKYFCDASDCIKTITVYDAGGSVKRINFLPNYEGVAVVATSHEIFAIQIEKNPNKKPQLIYRGTTPDFQIIDGDLYIKDGTFVAEVIL